MQSDSSQNQKCLCPPLALSALSIPTAVGMLKADNAETAILVKPKHHNSSSFFRSSDNRLLRIVQTMSKPN